MKSIHHKILDDFFDQLEPVTIDELVGTEWKGGYFYTGNNYGLLLSLPVLKWEGKRFTSKNDVNALVFRIANLQFELPVGKAKIIEMEFRDKVSVAMKYNMMPVWDHFRRVSDNILMGIMDAKLPTVGLFYFYLLQK